MNPGKIVCPRLLTGNGELFLTNLTQNGIHLIAKALQKAVIELLWMNIFDRHIFQLISKPLGGYNTFATPYMIVKGPHIMLTPSIYIHTAMKKGKE